MQSGPAGRAIARRTVVTSPGAMRERTPAGATDVPVHGPSRSAAEHVEASIMQRAATIDRHPAGASLCAGADGFVGTEGAAAARGVLLELGAVLGDERPRRH